MYKQKIGFAMTILILVILLTTGASNAEAPDMSQWLGEWFSYKVTMKGIAVNIDGSGIQKGSGSESGYLKITGWNQTDEYFTVNIYFLEDGAWQTDPQILKFMAGNNLTFLFLVKDEEGEEGVIIAALMQGKLKKDVLSSASIKSYAGITVENDDGNIKAGSVSLTGKMIPESKVPAAVLALP